MVVGYVFATPERGEVTEDDCHVAALLAMTVVYMRVYKSIPADGSDAIMFLGILGCKSSPAERSGCFIWHVIVL